MTVQELKIAAYNGTIPPEPLKSQELAFYYQAREAYAQYFDKRITQDEASQRIKDAIMRYNSDMQERQNGIDALCRIGALYKAIELAATAYRKDRTLDNADKLLEAIYGATMRKDKNL